MLSTLKKMCYVHAGVDTRLISLIFSIDDEFNMANRIRSESKILIQIVYVVVLDEYVQYPCKKRVDDILATQ